MSGSSRNPPAPDLSIDIDEDLLQAAVAAVEARSGPPARDPASEHTEGPPAVRSDAPSDDVLEVSPDRGDEPGRTRADDDDAWARLTAQRKQAEQAARHWKDKARTAFEEHLELAAEMERAWERAAEAEEARHRAEQHLEAAEHRIRQLQVQLERLQKRYRRELEKQRQHGHGNTVQELLPILDHLELALHHGDADPRSVVEGVAMIRDQFERALGRLGVERVEAKPGTSFDPAIHEAMMHLPSDEHPPGTVLREFVSGWRVNGRLLRAARVSVAAAPDEPDAQSEDATSFQEPPPEASGPEEIAGDPTSGARFAPTPESDDPAEEPGAEPPENPDGEQLES